MAFTARQIVEVADYLEVSVPYLVGEASTPTRVPTRQRDLADDLANFDAQVGARVHHLLFVRGGSSSQLAALLAIDRSSASQRLRATVAFKLRELIMIAREYRGTVGYLVGDVGATWRPEDVRATENQREFTPEFADMTAIRVESPRV